jgi:hypothetical protein
VSTLFLERQPRTRRGNLWGRPRGDGRILAILGPVWVLLSEIADRLGLSYDATRQALLRAKRRGAIEHRRGLGYRIAGRGASGARPAAGGSPR